MLPSSSHRDKTWNISVQVCYIVPFLGLPAQTSRSKTDCGAKNEIKPREPIRCKECGHRIIYKKRTKRSTYPVIQTKIRNLSTNSGAIRGAMIATPASNLPLSYSSLYILGATVPTLIVSENWLIQPGGGCVLIHVSGKQSTVSVALVRPGAG